MTAPTPALPDERPCQPLNNLQPAFSRRASGRPRWGADVHPGQWRLGCGQALAAPELQPRQHPQPDGQHTEQSGRRVVPFQRHRGQRQRSALQAAPCPCDPVFSAVRPYGLLQGPRLRWLGGARDPPAQLAPHRGHRRRVEADHPLHGPLQPPRGRPAALAPPGALPPRFRIPDAPHALHPLAAPRGLHRLPQGRRVGTVSPASAAPSARRDLRLGLG
jgi:hypothetical protein